MRTLYNTLLLAIILISASCNTLTDDSNEVKNIALDTKSAKLVEADNRFGLEVFQRTREISDEENLMVSPLSISLALAMAYNGADGETQTEMENAMKLNGLTPEQINTSYEMLIGALQSLDEKVVFEIANAIYYQQGFPIKQNFLDINHSVYDAEIESLEFGPAAVGIINNWVAEKTHDKILEIIKDLSPQDRLVLLNAIYFYGTWTKQFDEDGTKLNRFTKNDGTMSEVPMMSKEDNLEYTSNDLFKAVKLPYGMGQYQMTVMLPNDGYTSADLIDELSIENWKSWSKQYDTHENIVVTMPRFKYGFEMKLENILQEMGMQKAFSRSDADFSKISDQFLYISQVIHKTYIDVNETGTEAAAVTAIVFRTTSAGPDEKLRFTVDKPFVFAITEKDTDAILFIGEVQNPEYED